MKHLYAPWRSSYSAEVTNGKTEKTTEKECVFCQMFKDNNDEKHQILRRFKYNVVMMNHFPYNPGHILIIPLAHVPTLDKLPQEARVEMMELTSASQKILTDILDAHGVNIGINIGKAAGAGIPSHIHQHVLPRFFGDTNFLPALAETKQISFDLDEIYQKLKPAFDKITL
jgi:ATP adenylyltransferase